MDPTNQHQMQQLGFAFIGIAMLVGFVATAFIVWLYWRTLTKAGLSGPLALLTLVPGVGIFIPLCILAFSEWRVVPVPTASPYLPSAYPPPPPAFQPPPQA